MKKSSPTLSFFGNSADPTSSNDSKVSIAEMNAGILKFHLENTIAASHNSTLPDSIFVPQCVVNEKGRVYVKDIVYDLDYLKESVNQNKKG